MSGYKPLLPREYTTYMNQEKAPHLGDRRIGPTEQLAPGVYLTVEDDVMVSGPAANLQGTGLEMPEGEQVVEQSVDAFGIAARAITRRRKK